MVGTCETMAWDGTISSSDFYKAACAFIHRWKLINSDFPSWLWVPYQKLRWINSDDKVEGYLSLEKICLLRPLENEQEKGECLEEIDTVGAGNCNESLDEATLVPSPSDHQEVHYYDFHIIHSASYSVPVLYFRAYCCDGQPLMFEEIKKDLPSQSADTLLNSKWTFITQEEHPYLNRPWFKLHPCGTSEWMKLLFLSSDASLFKNEIAIERYVASWLSVVGQVVGLRIPMEMLNDGSGSQL
ncbi:ubiquitin-like-conjugating enzyme ATG10 isoform X1 [Benincasa hispida]|uniref:ubiquitin-like-conjugating enzyme ATG10 isoform X1 n=2 Tax=Benincasa hispida TaxID=102211 RepID=UPI00190073AB|nr:ubiquitin-like-conjugating enzyme ATG10 isoform X1 [Benincasa hispida]